MEVYISYKSYPPLGCWYLQHYPHPLCPHPLCPQPWCLYPSVFYQHLQAFLEKAHHQLKIIFIVALMFIQCFFSDGEPEPEWKRLLWQYLFIYSSEDLRRKYIYKLDLVWQIIEFKIDKLIIILYYLNCVSLTLTKHLTKFSWSILVLSWFLFSQDLSIYLSV